MSGIDNIPGEACPFAYEGPPSLRQPVHDALLRVTDPEMALAIVDIGLVRGVKVDGSRVEVRLTMTSAACPVADLVVEDVATELRRVLPEGSDVAVELVWEPPWTPGQMSERARRFMGW